MCNCCGMSDDEKKEWEEALAKKGGGEEESEVEVMPKIKNKGLRGLFKC